MDTDSFILHVKTDVIYKDIAKDVEKKLDTSNYEIDRPLPKGTNGKVIGLMKDELGGQIMKEFVGWAKTYGYLKESNHENKKAKGKKKCIIERELKFQDYKNCLNATKTDRKLMYFEEKIM